MGSKVVGTNSPQIGLIPCILFAGRFWTISGTMWLCRVGVGHLVLTVVWHLFGWSLQLLANIDRLIAFLLHVLFLMFVSQIGCLALQFLRIRDYKNEILKWFWVWRTWKISRVQAKLRVRTQDHGIVLNIKCICSLVAVIILLSFDLGTRLFIFSGCEMMLP